MEAHNMYAMTQAHKFIDQNGCKYFILKEKGRKKRWR